MIPINIKLHLDFVKGGEYWEWAEVFSYNEGEDLFEFLCRVQDAILEILEPDNADASNPEPLAIEDPNQSKLEDFA